jgi:signal transduction histidine kinase
MGLLRRVRGLAPPRRTARLRFTLLYGVLFLLSGVGLLAIVSLVTFGSTRSSRAVPSNLPVPPPSVDARIHALQTELSQAHNAQSRQLLVGSAIALAVMVVVSIVVGHVIAGRVLRPLRTMTATTRRISADNLHERLAVPGPADEVKDLADTIDELLERLEGAFTAQRRFIANASHELRTPLATMRASLDVALAKPAPIPEQTVALTDRIRTELDQVDRLLEGFLVLARTQHALPGRATFSFGDVVAEALDARAADLATLTTEEVIAHEDTWVRGSRTLCRRMVDNVIDNAIRHNQAEGWIVVSVTAGDMQRLIVESGGPVLDEEQVAQLAQPFRRLGADRTSSDGGTGLGLSIVAAIASAHGGTLELRARSEGGLRVGIALPPGVRA